MLSTQTLSATTRGRVAMPVGARGAGEKSALTPATKHRISTFDNCTALGPLPWGRL
jgi:hypothetical protein